MLQHERQQIVPVHLALRLGRGQMPPTLEHGALRLRQPHARSPHQDQGLSIFGMRGQPQGSGHAAKGKPHQADRPRGLQL